LHPLDVRWIGRSPFCIVATVEELEHHYGPAYTATLY